MCGIADNELHWFPSYLNIVIKWYFFQQEISSEFTVGYHGACKSYIQSKLYNGLSIWGCTAKDNLDLVWRIQNFCAKFTRDSPDYVHSR